jgi:dTDP-4-dehydrorhamnose 3,5-epimerase
MAVASGCFLPETRYDFAVNVSDVSVFPVLPVHTRCFDLEMHPDERGVFSELYREEWGVGVHPIQWNLVQSKPNVLRGVHVHIRHWDYLIVNAGSARIGLRDLRRASTSFGRTAMLEVHGDTLRAVVIPPGVAHGFYFLTSSTHVYAVSEYWNKDDELGCHWADSDLELDFGAPSPMLSARDASADSLSVLMEQLEPFQEGFNTSKG